MVDPTPFRRPINWAKLHAKDAERVVRDRAKNPANIIFGTHALERTGERSITVDDVFEILESGHVDGSPVKTAQGEWKCTFTRRMAGARSAGVVTIIFRRDKIFIKTVMWMD
jgi:hypothetical protein